MAALSPIFVDDRAGSQDLIPLLPDCESCRLSFGDVMWVGNGPTGPRTIAFELKSVSDLLASINTGRWQATQLPGLLAEHDEAWLLYYGAYRPGPSGVLQVRSGQGWRGFRLGPRPVPYGYLEGQLLDAVAAGCHTKWVHDIRDAAAWLSVSYRWWSKEWSDHKGLRCVDRSSLPVFMPHMDDRTRRCVEVASRLPGLGFEKAVSATEYFEGGIRRMINAPAEEWLEVPGVGKTIAKAINAAVE